MIRGFGVKEDFTGSRIDFDQVESKLIRPAMARCNLSGGATVIYLDAGSIHADMFGEILRADVVVCDFTSSALQQDTRWPKLDYRACATEDLRRAESGWARLTA